MIFLAGRGAPSGGFFRATQVSSAREDAFLKPESLSLSKFACICVRNKAKSPLARWVLCQDIPVPDVR